MLHYKRMTNEERDFFATVVAAAFANPFSKEREELDRKITGDTRTDFSREEMVHLVAVRVSERLKRLEREGRADFRIYRGPTGDSIAGYRHSQARSTSDLSMAW